MQTILTNPRKKPMITAGDVQYRSAQTARNAARKLMSNGGASAVEFAFLAPVLILLFAGICQFTLVLSNYVTLEHAVHAGARTMAISRGDTIPLTDTKNQILASAGNLAQ